MVRSLLAAQLCAVSAAAYVCAATAALAQPPIPEPRPAEGALSKPRSKDAAFRRYGAEVECLAKAVYFEARGEPLAGQYLVAKVIQNRMESRYYPKSICDVVYQNDHMRNACQFSFACDTIQDRIDDEEAFAVAKTVAKTSFSCDRACRKSGGPLNLSTHYHADHVAPSWSKKLENTGKIGRHIFYFAASM